MEEGAKRRLVGATVMVVLLVIFLPMLLEEDTPSPVSEREMSIPPRPDFETDYDASVGDDPIAPPVSGFPEYREPVPPDSRMPQELPPPTLFDAPATAEPELVDEPEPEIEPAPKPAPKSAPAPVVVEKPRPAAKPTPPPKATPAPRPPPEQPSAPEPATAKLSSWVIQVASLRERGRAYALVQKLRTKGFPAYIEEAQVRGQLWHRIRVGPEIARKRIETMATSIEAKMGLKVQIQRYP